MIELRILHLEDRDDDAELVQLALQRDGIVGEIDRADGADAFRKALEGSDPDIILSDYQLPDLDGMEALQMSRDLRPGTPFIFVTGYLGEEVAAETLKQGATDYVLKDRLARLPSSIRRAILETKRRFRLEAAQRALILSEERHRAISEVTSDYAFALSISADGTLIVDWMTGAFEGVTGHSPIGITTQALWEMVHPQDRQQATEDFQEMLAGTLDSSEFRIFTRQGQERWIRSFAQPVLDADGRIVGAYGAAKDITELRRSADTLVETREAFQALISSAPVAVFTMDADGIVTRWNPAAERLFGWSESEVLGRPYPVQSPDPDEVPGNRLRIVGGGRVEPYEGVRFHRDGSLRNVLINMGPLRGAEGKVTGVLGIFVDLTQVKRSQDALRRSERMAAEIVSTALEGIVVTDASGSILEFNPAAEEIFGYPRDAIIGANLDRLVPSERQDVHDAGNADLARNGLQDLLGRRVELSCVRFDGTVFPAELTTTQLGDVGQHVYASHIRDLTAQRQAEFEQKRAEEGLRQTVLALQRSDDDRRRLLDRMFIVQEEERHRIAGDIHDDSVQVMAAVGLRLDMLRESLEDPEKQAMLDRVRGTVRTSIHRLRHLMFELRPPALEQQGLAVAVATYLTRVEEESELTTELEDLLTREPPEETRLVLYRVIQEAITNSRKHSKATRVHVRLDQTEGTVVATITDDGCGFEMGDSLESPPGHLGISAMRERTVQAGGQLAIRTAPGKGTTVEIWIPLPAVNELTSASA